MESSLVVQPFRSKLLIGIISDLWSLWMSLMEFHQRPFNVQSIFLQFDMFEHNRVRKGKNPCQEVFKSPLAGRAGRRWCWLLAVNNWLLWAAITATWHFQTLLEAEAGDLGPMGCFTVTFAPRFARRRLRRMPRYQEFSKRCRCLEFVGGCDFPWSLIRV